MELGLYVRDALKSCTRCNANIKSCPAPFPEIVGNAIKIEDLRDLFR
jgi:hypothetical protein